MLKSPHCPHCMDSEGKSSAGVACRNNLLMQEGIGEKRYEELETDWKEKVRQEKVACWHAENVWSSCHQLGLPPLIFNPFQCTASCSIQYTALRYKVPMRSLHCSAFFTQNILYVRSSDYHLILLPPIPMHCYGISQMYSLLYTVDKLAHLTVNFVLEITKTVGFHISLSLDSWCQCCGSCLPHTPAVNIKLNIEDHLAGAPLLVGNVLNNMKSIQ